MFLQRIAAGDSSAVAQCLEQYGNLVWSVARKWSANVGDAEDAVQEIFIDLWKSAGRFDPEVASEPTFVMMIARRRLIDRRRKRGRMPATEMCNIDEPIGPMCDPATLAERGEDAAIAASLLSTLRPEERNVLLLSVQQGYSHQQIADQSGLPLGSVKTYIRRGLGKLRDHLSRPTSRSSARSVS